MKLTKRDYLIPAGLIGLSLVPALAGMARLGQIAGGAAATADNARFLAQPLPVVMHIVAALPFGILGALQFSPGFRKSNRPWHRMVGRVLVLAALVVAISGLWMTFNYPWPAADGVAVFAERVVAGSAMLWFVVMGIDAIRRRRFAEHGDWMTRAYAMGMGAGTQVLTHLPWFVFVDLHPMGVPRAVMMGLGWAINMAVAEWIIRRKAPKAVRVVAFA